MSKNNDEQRSVDDYNLPKNTSMYKIGAESIEDLDQLLRVYDSGIDAVVELGKSKPPGRSVVLMAVTSALMDKARESNIITSSNGGDIRRATVWEIVSIGPDVPESFPGRVGDHCVPQAAALDPLDKGWRTKYAVCEDEFIDDIWDPFALLAAMKANREDAAKFDPEDKRKKNLGL